MLYTMYIYDNIDEQGIMLNEIIQAKKGKHSMILFTYGIFKKLIL
jgi:hypothetical protein